MTTHHARWIQIGVTALVLAAVPATVRAGVGPCDAASRCPADLDGSGDVGFADLLTVIAAWGPCVGVCPADLDGSGDVGFADLLTTLSAWGPCGGVGTCAELAGSALGGFPHFTFVETFNEGSTIAIGFDPAAAHVTGVADVYVVAARTAAEWDADAALVDVRGDAQTIALDGGSIQANTFDLDESGDLGGDGGAAFGVGYDIVCDVNRNSVLDDPDVIDGRGDEAGFTVVSDTTALGPFTPVSVLYSGGSFLGQKTWYPEEIATLSPRPLVVISHGNGHQYTWYDYLQKHLASHGYVVMSHQNNTGPGIETASTTTLTNTDYLLGNLDTIGGGVLAGRIDSGRIAWIGHSRGGEGVCRAYDRMFDGDFVPDHYATSDIILISSIAPNDYLGRFQSNPHDANFHLLFGAADGDNGGWPDRESDASFHVFERAEGTRQNHYVHGADHNDFNCCGFNDFAGPAGTEIGRIEAQQVAKGTYLALLHHYAWGSEAAREFLWRQYETLRPIGVDADTIVDREYRTGPGPGVVVIDDFQGQSAITMSSSGGAVTFDVGNAVETQFDDTDGTFTWTPADPMNGMSRGRPDDLTRGLVFDWDAGDVAFLEFEVVPALRDVRDFRYLSFRACQGTRHPNTIAVLEDLTFTVTLRDGAGATSSINIGVYGGGVEEPYQRTGSGVGIGWQNEFEAIRIRLTDFRRNDTPLDLSDLAAIRLEFGGGFGSAEGRVAIDDVQFSEERPVVP
ncbi:MAG: hypothetical protein HKN62_04455 [Phycisphaerales bacterium]|nr:hypothetical protein [Phycisphaerales bacterium]